MHAPRTVLRQPTDPVRGVGLFSARPASLSFLPGDARGRITLRRIDAGHTASTAPAHIAALHTNAAWAALPPAFPIRNTTLAASHADTPAQRAADASAHIFATVEHVLSALAGLGVWDAFIHLHDACEVPILDGSALPFVEALRPHLVRPAHDPGASAEPTPLSLRAPVEVRAGDASIRAEPAPEIDYTYALDYGPASPLPPQQARWTGDPDDYAANIAPARTFSLRAEAHAARAAGLFAHLSPRDMLVVGDDGAPIDNAWRMPHEPARHKLLDLIGDLALLGAPLHARVVAHRSGHALTHEFCRAVLAAAR
ncbi:MAG: UDP-3-O-acyl-N-acetylglucosamine deacetylase [Planctomycetota bacterium]|nr:UDP-3-O-acyl-N-acetylglucosamine deacetylase [Planctomycetota bacterium]